YRSNCFEHLNGMYNENSRRQRVVCYLQAQSNLDQSYPVEECRVFFPIPQLNGFYQKYMAAIRLNKDTQSRVSLTEFFSCFARSGSSFAVDRDQDYKAANNFLKLSRPVTL